MNHVDIRRAAETAKLAHHHKRTAKQHCLKMVSASTALFLVLYILTEALKPYF